MKYSSSFTAGGLLFNEFEAILPALIAGNIEEFLRKESGENNYLKISTESARKRIITELKKRIISVPKEFWVHYSKSDDYQKKLFLFYVCTKTYLLIYDMHFKITTQAFWAYKQEIDIYPYKMYLDELSTKDEEIGSWSESTRQKCITNYFRMLRESGLLINKATKRPETVNDFYCYFVNHNETWALDIYFLDQTEKNKIINYCQ